LAAALVIWSMAALRSSAEADDSASHQPLMTVSRLLKSWATPPASRPMASIFCACRSCSCRRVCSLMSRRHPGELRTVLAVELRHREIEREARAVAPEADHLAAAPSIGRRRRDRATGDRRAAYLRARHQAIGAAAHDVGGGPAEHAFRRHD
jgi:hypothetical protein